METENIPLGNVQKRDLITRFEHDLDLDKKQNDFDHYSTSKSVSQNMLNISTIQGLISTMVNTFAIYGEVGLNGFQIALLVLIGVSVVLQFVIFVLLVVLAKSRKEKVNLKRGQKECATSTADLNSTVTSLTGLLLIITSAIAILSIYSTSTINPSLTATLINNSTST